MLLIKRYILQLFTNRLLSRQGLLFNYRSLSEAIQARDIQMSPNFMCTLIPSSAGIFFAFFLRQTLYISISSVKTSTISKIASWFLVSHLTI